MAKYTFRPTSQGKIEATRVDVKTPTRHYGLRHNPTYSNGLVKPFLAIWLLSVLASLAGLVVIAYIVFHFIAKFW